MDLLFQINRIAIDKNRSPSKSPSAPSQSAPTQTSHPPAHQGAGAMAAAPPPAQEGAGASGDEDEKGNFMFFSKYLYLHIWTPEIMGCFFF